MRTGGEDEQRHPQQYQQAHKEQRPLQAVQRKIVSIVSLGLAVCTTQQLTSSRTISISTYLLAHTAATDGR